MVVFVTTVMVWLMVFWMHDLVGHLSVVRNRPLQGNVLSVALLGVLLWPKLKASKTEKSLPVLEFLSSKNHEKITFSPE